MTFSAIGKTLTLLCFLFTVSMTAQYQQGTVYFKNGDTIQGWIKKKQSTIKFKEIERGKTKRLTFKKIKGFSTENEEYTYKYIYGSPKKKVLGYDPATRKVIYEKDDNGTPPELLRVVLKGTISLYALESTYVGMATPSGTFGGGSSVRYYMEKGSITDIGTRIKKKHFVYFQDCPVLMKKIEDKVLSPNNFIEIISFYNTQCTKN